MPFLTKGGKFVTKGGMLVTTDNPQACDCCVREGCLGDLDCRLRWETPLLSLYDFLGACPDPEPKILTDLTALNLTPKWECFVDPNEGLVFGKWTAELGGSDFENNCWLNCGFYVETDLRGYESGDVQLILQFGHCCNGKCQKDPCTKSDQPNPLP